MATQENASDALQGRWRIMKMDVWTVDVLDTGGPAHITFGRNGMGELAFVAVHVSLDVRYSFWDDQPYAAFSFEGDDDNEPTSGRGWVILGSDGRLEGHLFLHMGDDSGFVAERVPDGREDGNLNETT